MLEKPSRKAGETSEGPFKLFFFFFFSFTSILFVTFLSLIDMDILLLLPPYKLAFLTLLFLYYGYYLITWYLVRKARSKRVETESNRKDLKTTIKN